MAETRGYFPIFLRVSGSKALVVGGGRVALRKCRDLHAAGARVRAVAPLFCVELKRLSSIQRSERRFRATDVRGAALVVAATDSQEVNRRVAAAARQFGIPVNVVDGPELSTFIVPAVLRRGPIVIAVSTGGASPALARRLRDVVSRTVTRQMGRHAAFLARVRGKVLKKVANAERRRAILERLAGADAAAMIESRGLRRANAMVNAWIREANESEDSALESSSGWDGPGHPRSK